MRTLLNLFFIPYLRFLGKFHLYALPVMVLVFLVKIQELMVIAPMLYMFSLYATSNRHQFKENIPWMLATFNKRTLVRYHLLAQTMVLATQSLMVSVMGVLFFSATILFAPEASEQVLPDLPTASSKGSAAVITKGISPLANTKEQLIVAVVLMFFLITMYSPMSLKEYLRQMEEKNGKLSWQRQLRDFSFLVVAGFALYWLKPANWMVVLLSSLLVAGVAYLGWMFNRAFVLFHPRHYKAAGVGVAAMIALVSTSVYQLSYQRFLSHKVAEVRLGELDFLGVFAPPLSKQQFTQIASQVKDPQVVVEMLNKPQFQGLVEAEQLKKWVMDAKELSVALRLVKKLPLAELAWLNQQEVWTHLDKLYADLQARNTASAEWQAKTFERHLHKIGWRPRAGSKLGALETVVMQQWSERQARMPASSR